MDKCIACYHKAQGGGAVFCGTFDPLKIIFFLCLGERIFPLVGPSLVDPGRVVGARGAPRDILVNHKLLTPGLRLKIPTDENQIGNIFSNSCVFKRLFRFLSF